MYRISFHLKQNPKLRSLKLNQLCIKNLQFTTNYKFFQAIGRKELMQPNSYCLVKSRLRRVECCIDKITHPTFPLQHFLSSQHHSQVAQFMNNTKESRFLDTRSLVKSCPILLFTPKPTCERWVPLLSPTYNPTLQYPYIGKLIKLFQ